MEVVRMSVLPEQAEQRNIDNAIAHGRELGE